MKALRNLMVLLALSLGPVSTIAMAQTVPAPVEVSDEVLEETEGRLLPIVYATVVVIVRAVAVNLAKNAVSSAAAGAASAGVQAVVKGESAAGVAKSAAAGAVGGVVSAASGGNKVSAAIAGGAAKGLVDRATGK